MSLEYYYDEYNIKSNPQFLFDKCEERIAKKKQAIEDLKNELMLLEDQAIQTYKNCVYYFKLNPDTIRRAREWLWMLKNNKDSDGNKIDKRKKYEEKPYFEFIRNYMKEILGIPNIEITSIIDVNWGQANDIEFNYLGHTWRLEVPTIKHTFIKDYQNYGNIVFKLRLCHCNELLIETIGSTFEEEELANIMQKGIEKYCKLECKEE